MSDDPEFDVRYFAEETKEGFEQLYGIFLIILLLLSTWTGELIDCAKRRSQKEKNEESLPYKRNSQFLSTFSPNILFYSCFVQIFSFQHSTYS
jgi:hypothetical protein